MSHGLPLARPLRSVGLAMAVFLGALFVPAGVAAETVDELIASLAASGFACGPVNGGTNCERQIGASDTDKDAAAFFPFGAGRSAGVGRDTFGVEWDATIEAIAVRVAESTCAGGGARVAPLVARARSAPAPNSAEETVGSCRILVTTDSQPTDAGPYQHVGVEVFNDAAPLASSPPPSSVQPGAPAASAPVASPVITGAVESGGARPAFAAAVPRPADVVTEPATVAASLALTLIAILLVPFPGVLFNSTLEAHHDEIRGWFRRPGRRPPRTEAALAERPADVVPAGPARSFWASPLGVVTFLAVSAVLYGFLDPGFGRDASSVPMYLGTLIGLTAVTALSILAPWRAHARVGVPGRMRALPLTLAVGVVCVLISRVTGFLPGYLYGLLVTVEFVRGIDPRDEARGAAAGAAFLLGIAGLAWLGLGLLPADDAGDLVAIAATALTSLVVAGLEGVVFGLIPIRFLPGSAVFAWSRPAWTVLYGLGVFGFFHVLMNPAGGYLASSARTPLITIVGLLVGFSAASIAFWGWFRFRRPSAPSHEE